MTTENSHHFPEHSVSTQWLAEHLDDPTLVIIDCRKSKPGVTPAIDFYARYLDAHIPGALFIEIDAISDCTQGLPHMLPSAEAFSISMGERGISDQANIVVYDEGDLFSAPRIWWMLKSFGATQVRILDGGLNAWLTEKRPLSSVESPRTACEFNARLSQPVVVNAQQVMAALGKIQIIDARSAARFHAQVDEPRPGSRRGHIPGSLNIPFNEITANGHLKSASELRTTFQQAGVALDQPIIASCGSGVTAASLTFALSALGINDVLIYDGAWAEWGAASSHWPIEAN
jgi:thiosulfate/3-mercaptopyruvate sulfurtransferase